MGRPVRSLLARLFSGRRLAVALGAGLLVGLLGPTAGAEEAPPGGGLVLPKGSRRDAEEREYFAATGTAALVGVGAGGGEGTLGAAAVLQTAEYYELWSAFDDPDFVPPLDPRFLDKVRDERPVGTFQKNEGEALAYCDAVSKAHLTRPEAFAKLARRDLTYAHLFNQPSAYRGQVVHVEGRLLRARRFTPPAQVQQVGVTDLYEGWVFDRLYSDNPYCVIFTRLPAGVEVGEQLDHQVAFDGYFFKRYRYKAADSFKPEEGREVPLLIGPTLTVLDRPATPGPSWSLEYLPPFLGVAAGAVALVIGLGWWLRRGDRLVRARVAPYSVPFVDPSAAAEALNGAAKTGYVEAEPFAGERRGSSPPADPPA